MKNVLSQGKCRISRLDEELSLFRENTLVVFGCGSAGAKVYYYLKSKGIEPYGFCDNNEVRWGGEYCGKQVLPPSKLQEFDIGELVVLIASVYEEQISKQLKEMGIREIVTYSEFVFVKRVLEDRLEDVADSFCVRKKDEDDIIQIKWCERRTKLRRDLNKLNQYYSDRNIWLFCASPLKTGNTTIVASCEYYNVPIAFTDHTLSAFYADVIKTNVDKRIKIIMGIREPLSHQLSQLFMLGFSFRYDDHLLTPHGIQHFFDKYHVNACDKYYDRVMKECEQPIEQMDFLEGQVKKYLGIDVYQSPFNKDKGYVIIKQGHVEILIYQLEKLDSLEKEIREFIEVEEFKLITKNVGEKKWYNQYYQETKENICIPKCYIDYHYNSKFMNHFYSDKDIDKFKEKWRGQIV